MNSGKIRLPTNKTNLRENILPHDHKEQQQNDQVLSQNTSKGGAPSNEEPPKKKGTTTAREPCILCGNDIKFMEKRNYVNRCNNNSKTCIFHDHPA